MNRKIIIILIVGLAIGLAIAVNSLFHPLTSEAEAGADGQKTLVVALVGVGQGAESMVPDIDGDGQDDAATCFPVDMMDVRTGNIVGQASDCLSNMETFGDGIALINTTYFYFEEGTLVSRTQTTVQPTTLGSERFSHITGAVPAPGEKNILEAEGTGEFAGRDGNARLAGAADLSNFGSGEITFNCLFVLNLD